MIYQNNTRTEFFDIYRTELPDSLQEPRGSRPIFFIRWLPRSNHSYPKHYQNNSFCTLYSKNIVFLIFMIIALKSYTSSPGEPDAYSLSSV